MKFLVIIGALLSATLIQGAPKTLVHFPEDSRSENGKVVGGHLAAQNQFPYMVHLYMNSIAGSQLCGGSLISQRHVITAGHCLTRATSVIVSLGSINSNAAQLIVPAQKYIIHPQYNPNNLNNDIGIVDMQQTVPLSNSIRPITLARMSQMNESFVDRVATVSGWGYLTENGPVTSLLHYANMEIISNDKCIEEYNDEIVIDSTICAVGYAGPGQNACNGDSGGALVTQEENGDWIQVGLVNFVSVVGCTSGKPSGYIRPHHYWEFISEYTGIPIRE